MEMYIWLFAIIAAAYALVGHGGASAYLALMALLGFAPVEMKPLALTLNLCVSALASFQFFRAGYFKFQRFWPLILGSVPLAYVGGMHTTSLGTFKALVGISLLVAALGLIYKKNRQESELRPLPWTTAIAVGGAIGLLSGLTGVGGGIYLSPLLIWGRFANLKETAALAAPFILVNSMSGLLGMGGVTQHLPQKLPWILLSVCVGGIIGSYFGPRIQRPLKLRLALAGVLVFSAIKFVLV